MVECTYLERETNTAMEALLRKQGAPAVVARLLAARGVTDLGQTAEDVGLLLRPTDLLGGQDAGEMLADAVCTNKKIVVVADYDCDGASACAVMLRGLRLLGAGPHLLGYVVPDRAIHGYGLTPPIVDQALALGAEILVTVDNGIASFEGVAYARSKGLKVLVTDHHLPAAHDGSVSLPAADVIVNPNQPGCSFASKAMCGTGVAFYVMLLTRAALRERQWFKTSQPTLAGLLDLVALATVADVVKLDENNRRLVAQGLRRIRAGRACAGIASLLAVSNIDPTKVTATDFAFRVGPRVNAAGRLADMRVGIACLVEDDPQRAMDMAKELNDINDMRREVQEETGEIAQRLVAEGAGLSRNSLVVYDDSFHEGVVGIIAGRLKDSWHLPTFVFAPSQSGLAKGSGRSIAGVHLRDVLDCVSKRHPGLLLRFGGHAAAAGATIAADRVADFGRAFDDACEAVMTAPMRERIVLHDGALSAEQCTIQTAEALAACVWGQGFEAPLFVNRASVRSQRVLKEKHLKVELELDGVPREAVWFGRTEPLPGEVDVVYEIGVHEWQGRKSVQLILRDIARGNSAPSTS